ncbi:non-ribosomal peptide synthetase, partial [Flavobacterium cellulosilyticum]
MESQSQTQIEIQFNPFLPEIERVIYTTNSQLEIWTDCVFGGSDANKAYNLSVSIKFTGNLVIDALENAVKTLVDRHECLRANFSSNGRFMNIFRDFIIDISHNDISQLPTIDKEKSKDTIIKDELNSLFDLVNGPLFKVKLIKTDEFEHILVITHHHIIGDGLSFDIILEELSTLYSAQVENKVPNLPNPERFSEFAERINSLMESDEYQHLEDFWLKIYEESVPLVNLPIDNIRPSLRTYNSQRLDFPVDDNLINSLKLVGISSGCSLVTTLLAAFELFLSKQTGQNDLVVGFPSSGNILYDMRQMVGDCVNLLPLRSNISSNISFIDYLKQRNSQLFDAYDHQQVSFGHLLHKFAIARDPSRVPLVPVILTVDLNRDIESEFSFSGLSHEFKINPREYATFEIQLHAFRTKNGPSFQWSYNTTLFKPDTIKKMMLSFEQILQKIVEDPSKTIEQISYQDYTSAYNELNATSTNYSNVALHDLIALQAQKTPKNIALGFNDKVISYEDLQEQTNQMAHYLKAQGVLPGDFIAVSIPRCPELVISLLAIMQCGAAYLPLDHEYPLARLEFMLEDSEAKFLLTSNTLLNALPKWSNSILIEDAITALNQYPATKLQNRVDPESIVYLLYTSGSTGKPKGVPITHKNLVNLLSTVAIEPGIKETDRLLSITTISFDIAGLELYLPLIKGATLILADHDTARDGRLLLEMLEKEK